jgi:hypothetical protein
MINLPFKVEYRPLASIAYIRYAVLLLVFTFAVFLPFFPSSFGTLKLWVFFIMVIYLPIYISCRSSTSDIIFYQDRVEITYLYGSAPFYRKLINPKITEIPVSQIVNAVFSMQHYIFGYQLTLYVKKNGNTTQDDRQSVFQMLRSNMIKIGMPERDGYTVGQILKDNYGLTPHFRWPSPKWQNIKSSPLQLNGVNDSAVMFWVVAVMTAFMVAAIYVYVQTKNLF